MTITPEYLNAPVATWGHVSEPPTDEVTAALDILKVAGYELAGYTASHHCVSRGAHVGPRREENQVVLGYEYEHHSDDPDFYRARERRIRGCEIHASQYAELFTALGWSVTEYREEGRLLRLILAPGKNPAPARTAAVRATVIDGIHVRDFVSSELRPRHRCHTTDSIVGYVVRETMRNGTLLTRGEPDARGAYPVCGYDVFAVSGGGNYVATFPVRDSYRTADGENWAVVDSLYACGCRSGI